MSTCDGGNFFTPLFCFAQRGVKGIFTVIFKSISWNYLALQSKVNQMRSPDLDFCLKIRIFDLEGLRGFVSKKIVETVQI